MSWGTCYNGSNNIYSNFESLMSDSRKFTDYSSEYNVENKLRNELKIHNNTEYRHYLQNNSNKIISNNQVKACNSCSYCQYTENFEVTEKDYIFRGNLQKNPNFGYNNSDLKNIYLSREKINMELNLPTFYIEESGEITKKK